MVCRRFYRESSGFWSPSALRATNDDCFVESPIETERLRQLGGWGRAESPGSRSW